MLNKITLNEKEFDFKEEFLPSLITYEEKSGGSHYSVSVIANMFSNGSKILFFTAYPMAKENFLEQVGLDDSKISFIQNKEDLENNKNKQCLILESGNQELLEYALDSLTDIKERVILIKNIEKFNDNLILKSLNFDRLILSGHLDESNVKEEIIKKDYKNIIIFNNPALELKVKAPFLEKYTAYFWTKDSQGITKVQI